MRFPPQGNITTTVTILDETIVNVDVSPTAAIDAIKIGDGSVTNAEFQRLDATSSIQTQMDGKQASLGFTPENIANKAAVSGYASLDASTKIPITQVPTGSSSTTVCIGNDARLSDARTPTTHKTTHEPLGSDALTALDNTSIVVGANIAKSKISSTGSWANSEIAQLPALGIAPSPARQTVIVNAEISTVDTSKITTGTIATARLGSGTADSTTFLRGDSTWASPAAGSTNIKETEIDFGTTAYQTDKTFNVVDADVSTSSQLLALVSHKAPSDGRNIDEIFCEDFEIICKANVWVKIKLL